MSGASATEPLRLLVLATTFPARAGDGTPEFVLTLSAALAAAGVEVHAVVPRVPGAPAREVVEGVDVRRFAYFPRRFEGLAHGAIMANLRAQRWRAAEAPPLVAAFGAAARREVRRVRPHVVHAHWLVPAGLVALGLRRTAGVPYVVTAHGADAYTLRSAAALRAKRAVVAGAAATVPVSAAIGEALAPLGPVAAPIPMGVDVVRIAAEVGLRAPEPGRVLFVGRLVEKKGVDVLLRALALVPEAGAVVVGDGPARPTLEALAAELGLGGRARFLGQQPRAAVMAELARAAVVALPSQVGAGGDQDGTPVVLGEAVAAGVPVVASDLGGLSEHVADGETGWVVPPGSVEALAAALRDTVADPAEAGRRAAAARAALAGTLDLASVARRYRSVLEAAAHRAPRPGPAGVGAGLDAG
ncbi:MAG TPA: glycosyltransferase [Acidimicrobiales bacterium]|nr:glycosyltransferase [Acidimicrobiales bacterium]